MIMKIMILKERETMMINRFLINDLEMINANSLINNS